MVINTENNLPQFPKVTLVSLALNLNQERILAHPDHQLSDILVSNVDLGKLVNYHRVMIVKALGESITTEDNGPMFKVLELTDSEEDVVVGEMIVLKNYLEARLLAYKKQILPSLGVHYLPGPNDFSYELFQEFKRKNIAFYSEDQMRTCSDYLKIYGDFGLDKAVQDIDAYIKELLSPWRTLGGRHSAKTQGINREGAEAKANLLEEIKKWLIADANKKGQFLKPAEEKPNKARKYKYSG